MIFKILTILNFILIISLIGILIFVAMKVNEILKDVEKQTGDIGDLTDQLNSQKSLRMKNSQDLNRTVVEDIVNQKSNEIKKDLNRNIESIVSNKLNTLNGMEGKFSDMEIQIEKMRKRILKLHQDQDKEIDESIKYSQELRRFVESENQELRRFVEENVEFLKRSLREIEQQNSSGQNNQQIESLRQEFTQQIDRTAQRLNERIQQVGQLVREVQQSLASQP